VEYIFLGIDMVVILSIKCTVKPSILLREYLYVWKSANKFIIVLFICP